MANSKNTARELSLGGAIEALTSHNGQSLFDTIRKASTAQKAADTAAENFSEAALAVKAHMVETGLNPELLDHRAPDADASLTERALFTFITNAVIETRFDARKAALFKKPAADCKGQWYIETTETINGVTKKVKKPNPKTESGRRRLVHNQVPQYRKRFVEALKREFNADTTGGRSPNRKGTWLDTRTKGLMAHIDAIKNAKPEQIGKGDAVVAQVLLERAIDCLTGKAPKSVIAKYKAALK